MIFTVSSIVNSVNILDKSYMIKKKHFNTPSAGFIGQIFVNILQKKNNITLIGSSGDINLLIGENITESIKDYWLEKMI